MACAWPAAQMQTNAQHDMVMHHLNSVTFDGRPASYTAMTRQTGATRAGWTVLHYAVEGGSPDIVSALLAACPGVAQAGCGGGRSKATEPATSTALRESTASQQQQPFTPLHLAAQKGHASLIAQLLAAGYHATDTAGVATDHHVTTTFLGMACTGTLQIICMATRSCDRMPSNHIPPDITCTSLAFILSPDTFGAGACLPVVTGQPQSHQNAMPFGGLIAPCMHDVRILPGHEAPCHRH